MPPPNAVDPIRLIRSELRRSLHGPAWHGPALLEALGDVTAAEAQARQLAGAHTIGEIAMHALAWIEEVTRRLSGAPAHLPERGDWPAPESGTPAEWAALLDLIRQAGESLDQAVAAFAAERLLDRVDGPVLEPSVGSGVSYASMLHGLAQHTAYHGGQIALLKGAFRRGAASR